MNEREKPLFKRVASIQVRMGSTRLPGKVMLEVDGKPLLGHLLDRLEQCRTLDQIVVATSIAEENDVIEEYCLSRKVEIFRGDENDVLGRTLGALSMCQADVGIEVFGDCPLIDPRIVDEIVECFGQAGDLDFVGNDLSTTYPPGMEVEVFSVAALADAASRTDDPDIREHGTLFIRQRPDLYKIRNYSAPGTYHRPDLSLEIDTSEDLFVISAIIEAFSGRPDYSLGDIIEFMDENPVIAKINRDVPRRWEQFREK